MSAWLEMLVVATLASGAAALGLKLLPDAPPRTRFRIALAGLVAWIVPWPMIAVSVELPAAWPLADWAGGALGALAFEGTGSPAAGGAAGGPEPLFGVLEPLHLVAAALFLPGLLRFAGDAAALRASLRDWRRRSRGAEWMLDLAPPELRGTRARIRSVADARVAAASGWLRPTVWIGERLCATELAIALTHELWHVQRRDPIWLTLVTAISRLYWWNPLVARLGREARLMIESDCDRRCARDLGRSRYVEGLAGMMLDGAVDSPRLAAHARSLNVRRLELLGRTVRFRARDGVLIAALTALASLAAASQIFRFEPDGTAWSRVAIPETPAGRALGAVLEAFNAHDAVLMSGYLGAFTPQEVELRGFGPVEAAAGTLELVDILRSEPFRIEYVVRESTGGTTRVGRLEVAADDGMRVERVELEPVSMAGL